MHHLIKECDNNARKSREEITLRLDVTNMKFYNYYSLKREGIPESRSMNKVVKIIDTKDNKEK